MENKPTPQFEPLRQTPKPVYTGKDTAYAWLSLLFAFLFCQAVPVVNHPMGAFLVIVGLYVSGFVVLIVKKAKIGPVCILSAISSLVIASALLLTNTKFLINLSMTYCLASYCYFIYAALGNRIEEGFSDYVYIDFIKIIFIMPFCCLFSIFPAIFNKRNGRGSWLLVKIIIGIMLAVIPTGLVLLFLSYDSGFIKILDNIFAFEWGEVFHTIVSLIFTVPLAMYGFGLYAASDRKKLHTTMTVQGCDKVLSKTKILPQLTAVVAVLPIVFLYVVFFVSQWKYYVSGFTGVLPEELSYAEYARKGFFELCAVSVINLLMIVGIAFFIRRGKNGKSVILGIVASVLCLCTLILISTAVSKLVMYIETYGLTQKRIYAMWLMVLIGIMFVVIAVGQFVKKPKTVAVCLSVAIVMFAALSVCNVNALCARYNADRYLAGTLDTLDVDAMSKLGDSAIPSLVKVVNAMDDKKESELADQIHEVLTAAVEKNKEEKFSVFGFSVPDAQAKAALKDYTPPEKPADPAQ